MTQKLGDVGGGYDIPPDYRSLFIHGAILLACLIAYGASRPILGVVLIDVLLIPRETLYCMEFPVVWTLLVGVLLFEVRYVVYAERLGYLIRIDRLIDESIEVYDKNNIDDYYRQNIKPNIVNHGRGGGYLDIPFQRLKTVYAITGNWRAGKTTAAGYVVGEIRRDSDATVLGEYYHDTFNFGSIHESIEAFFDQIAKMTGVKEFRMLGRISSPDVGVDMVIGPFKFRKSEGVMRSANQVRGVIYDKITNLEGIFTIVIDDIDRLTKEEQLQWLRTIELLGKFEQRLIVIVPVNETVLEINVEGSNISKKYIDKILPHKLPIGVDIGFIRSQFKHDTGDDQILKKYARYIFALAIRTAILEHQIKKRDRGLWVGAFYSGDISEVARLIGQRVAVTESPSSDSHGWVSTVYRATYGVHGEFTVDTENGRGLVLNNTGGEGAKFQNSYFATIARNMFGAGSDRMGDNTEVFWEKSIRYLMDYSYLRRNFGDVKFKELTGDDTSSNIQYSKVSGDEYDVWLHIIYPIVEGVTSDRALRRYFTYDIVRDEVAELLNINNPEDELVYFTKLILGGSKAI